MHEYCHRCGGELPASDGVSPFCPHCGSPQIYLQDYESQSGAPENNTTSAVPPPKPRQVEWKTAMRCALLVAVIAAALNQVAQVATRVQIVTLVSMLWIVSGSLITLALYQHRRPLAWMDARVGARIGVVVGLALVACLGIAIAVGGLVSRYALHSMSGIDAQLSELLRVEFNQLNAMAPVSPGERALLFAPEFRAGMMLLGFGVMSCFLLVLSTVGGALGGFMRMRRKISV